MPVARPMPAAAINIPGPGPSEPRDTSVSPLPPTKTSDPITSGPGSSTELIDSASTEDATQDTHDTHEGNGEEEEEVASPSLGATDPYANLDNAFGGYLADEPRPQADNRLVGLF